MCEFILKLFHKWQPPYPEEKFNPDATEDNVIIEDIIDSWFWHYDVPEEYHDYWLYKIDIKIDAIFPYAAGVWESNGIRHLTAQPGWFNKGVLAHEQAHNSYFTMTEEKKDSFKSAYLALRDSESLKHLKDYKAVFKLEPDELCPWHNNVPAIIEQHAEIYRYLGTQMPQVLKQFYPKLF